MQPNEDAAPQSASKAPAAPPSSCPPVVSDGDLRWSTQWASFGVWFKAWHRMEEWRQLTASDITVFLEIVGCCSPSKSRPHRYWDIYDYQLAGNLGMDRSTVNRAKHKLESLGFVRVHRARPGHAPGLYRWWLREPTVVSVEVA